ncbi:MAG: ABC transporter ATP-binding protein [Actinobacteria bacterium]|nr:ABC transporter ATP-binding protein [Actinomycetota bacterium]
MEIRGLAKRYATGETTVIALNGVDLTAEPGALIAIMGPSGSGKSTLLHVVGAMDVADEGEIVVGGRAVTALSRSELVEYRRRIGFVFQRFHLLPALTALDNVLAPVLPYKVDFDKDARGRELLASVGLGSREDALPSELSGGEQQRVAIARALVNDPFLLLADEPTGNLDSQTSAEIVELLLEVRRARGMTAFIGTHDALVASRCDRIVRLLDGRIVDEVEVPRGLEPEAVLDRITRVEST